MSSRNAYRISVQRDNPRLYNRLHEKLNELFNGHVDETGYGFYAEDCPVAGEAFRDSPRYVKPSALQRELTQPSYSDWDTFTSDKEQWDDFDADTPDQTAPYTEIIESVVHEYQNDTSGADTETTLDL